MKNFTTQCRVILIFKDIGQFYRKVCINKQSCVAWTQAEAVSIS